MYQDTFGGILTSANLTNTPYVVLNGLNVPLSYYTNTPASQETVTLATRIGSPYPVPIVTNTTTVPIVLTNSPSGEYFVIPAGQCGWQFMSPQPPGFPLTNVVVSTNIITQATNTSTTLTNAAGFVASVSVVTYFTNHTYVVYPIIGLDRLRIRLVRIDALEQDRRLRIAHGVAGRRVLEARRRDDLAGDRLLEPLALVRVDAEQPRDLLLLVRADVQESRRPRSTVPENTRRKATLRPSSIAILNTSAANGSLFFGARVIFSPGLPSLIVRGSTPVHRRDIGRRRQVRDDRIEQRVDALVAQRGAAEHGDHLHGDRRLADAASSSAGVRSAPSRYFAAIASSSRRAPRSSRRARWRPARRARAGCRRARRVGDLAGERDRLHRDEIDAALERVLDIVESDAMSDLRVAERDNMAPLIIGASLLIISVFPGQLGTRWLGM